MVAPVEEEMNAKGHRQPPHLPPSPTLGGGDLNLSSRQTHRLCANLWITKTSAG